ncbi:phosphoribosyltransferase-like protein [Bacillus cereus]|uniref:phosphoribosyltransferase-like protein n=1 Tax=Bacillus cereus TaxID=1396 RepID=UPI000BEBD81F|nr:hypothetical protein [Bacillus cereus]PDZ79361.1 hypothetical protein CON31_11950 [Bacillus cereus]PEW28456.1 hypothetical protein CN441_24400 [Bacillus cereus]PGR20125.1 hypothetical protein COA25_08355 [Bacillus cereus]
MSTTTENMIEAIVKIAEDYEGTNFTDTHVENWLTQFPSNQHDLILQELHNILSKTYISKAEVIEAYEALIENKTIFPQSIDTYKFINPQTRGGSQKDMLEIMEGVVQENHGFSLDDCGQNNITSYVYIDDAIYTGNRVIRDIQKWANEIDDPSLVLQIDIIVLALHNRNKGYVEKQIKKVFPQATINFWHCIRFYDDILKAEKTFESYLPSSELEYNGQTKQYIESVSETRTTAQNERVPLLRNIGEPTSDEYFTSLQNRNLVEKIFFEKGVEIVSYAANPNRNMRPMGYDNSKTLGFGSYFVTYRNIANNCPVVLWWGDPDAFSGIDNWYPLFPRTAN